jgi:phage terminase Nu1 subunit (DNA packaging protein)
LKILKMEDTATSAELGRRLGLTIEQIDARASVLVKAKPRGCYRLKASIQALCGHIRAEASGRESSITLERRRLLEGQADMVELRTKFESGELLEAAIVEARWSGVIREVRAGFMALASRIGAAVPHLDRGELNEVDLGIRALLTEAGDEIIQETTGESHNHGE